MKYIKLVFELGEEYHESLIAQLMDMDFDAFEQQEDTLITYVTKERFNDVHREKIEQLLTGYPGNNSVLSEEVVADKNWNEAWEETIKAQRIGGFFIKPSWANERADNEAVELIIDPKMAFGTGYHETTRLMLRAVGERVARGDRVLDAGTGTGILAIAAAKLGARQVVGFDVDQWSFDNARENIWINDVAERVRILKGSVNVIPEEYRFDLVLANINRNTIDELLGQLVKLVDSNGYLVLSGLLKSDKRHILNKDELKYFKSFKIEQESDWIAIHLQKMV